MVLQKFGGLKVTKESAPEGWIRRLKKGDVVNVTEIEVCGNEIRGKIKDGWISMINMFHNLRFVERRSPANDTLLHVAELSKNTENLLACMTEKINEGL